ncbi:MAG: lipopolysaccharide biosynthesis protein, partial [Candidatus Nucleicultricaceae bacterium]
MSKQIFKNIRLLSLKSTDIVHLIKNTFWYGLLNSIYSLSLFLLVPYMTGKLSPNDYGLYSLYILFLTIISPIVGCGLSQAVMRAHADAPKNKR